MVPEKVDKLPISQEALDALGGKERKKEGKEDQDEKDHEETDSEKKSFLKVFLWVAAIIILVLVILIFSRPLLPSQNPAKTVMYNTYEFTKADGDLIWYTKWNRNNITYVLPFRHTPYEVENISFEGKLDSRFNQKIIYITHDPADGNLSQVALSATALSQALAKAFNLTPAGACARNETGLHPH